ncbi:MAG: hypothetical protein ACXIUP_01995 [Microcella sp.]
MLYSPYPPQRARQLAADAVGIVAAIAVVVITSTVVAAIRAVAELGRQLETAGGSISEGLSTAGERLGGIPLIGDAVTRPFDAAAGAGDSVSDAGLAVVDVVETTAVVAGWIVALSLLALLSLVWVWPRARFVVRRGRAERMIAAGMSTNTFALRALATARLSALGRVHPDPGSVLLAGDESTIRALAELELRRLGVAKDRLP